MVTDDIDGSGLIDSKTELEQIVIHVSFFAQQHHLQSDDDEASPLMTRATDVDSGNADLTQ